MVIINPYLVFKNNAEEAFIFYKSVFGGEFSFVQRFKDAPHEDNKLSESENNKIMHIALPIGNKTVLMGSDAPESMAQSITTGSNFSISVSTGTKEETEEIFKGLSSGGKVDMKLQDTFWGAYFGMLTDKFGIHWMVSYDKNQRE